jgi:hypothetical protein
MRAPALAVSLHPRSVPARRAAAVVATGLAIGLVANLAFGVIHALLIVPIWRQLAGGLPFAVLAAIGLAWAFDSVADARGWRTAADGARFGLAMFATLLPAAAVDAWMRSNGLRLGDTTIGMIAAVLMFAASGAAAGVMLSRRGSAVISFGLAALALMAVAGGPLPVARSVRALELSLGIGVICVVSGALLARARTFVLGEIP